jgi:hypothetical protein
VLGHAGAALQGLPAAVLVAAEIRKVEGSLIVELGSQKQRKESS